MTSIEWLIKELYTEMNMSGDGRVLDEILEEAKEMHKQEIIDAFKSGLKSPYHQDYTFVTQDNQEGTKSAQYYQETFVSKGSDDTLKDYHIVDTNEMVELPKQETLYTEEQVREAMAKARLYKSSENADIIIQSLKQPKQ